MATMTIVTNPPTEASISAVAVNVNDVTVVTQPNFGVLASHNSSHKNHMHVPYITIMSDKSSVSPFNNSNIHINGNESTYTASEQQQQQLNGNTAGHRSSQQMEGVVGEDDHVFYTSNENNEDRTTQLQLQLQLQHLSSVHPYPSSSMMKPYHHRGSKVMTSPKMSKHHIYSAIGSLEHSYGSCSNSGPLSMASSSVATVSVHQQAGTSNNSYNFVNSTFGTTPPLGIGVNSSSGNKVQLNRNHVFSQHPHYRSHFLTPRSGSISSKDEQSQQQHQQLKQHYGSRECNKKSAQHQEEERLVIKQDIPRDIVAVGNPAQMDMGGHQDVQDAFDPFGKDSSDQRRLDGSKQRNAPASSALHHSMDDGAQTAVVALNEGAKSQQKYHGNLDRQLQESDARAKQQEHDDSKESSPVTTPETARMTTPFTSMNTMDKYGSESNLQSFAEEKTKVTHKKSRKKKKKVKINGTATETFRPSCDAYTPRVNAKKIDYKPAKERSSEAMSTKMGTLSRPNFRDALRRVAMIIHQHITKIERRNEEVPFTNHAKGLFNKTMMDNFSEENFVSPRYKCTMVRIPMARTGVVCSMKKIKTDHEIPMEDEIYEFAHKLFKTVQLSSECSIVCLIYVERLMEIAKVPLMAHTWRPIVMCGLLLASKVWQDLSSWNIEFSTVYPQFSLASINKLELLFLRQVKWDLYISSRLVSVIRFFFCRLF